MDHPFAFRTRFPDNPHRLPLVGIFDNPDNWYYNGDSLTKQTIDEVMDEADDEEDYYVGELSIIDNINFRYTSSSSGVLLGHSIYL